MVLKAGGTCNRFSVSPIYIIYKVNQMSGKELYALYQEGFANENTGVDEWNDLDEKDQRVWNWMANDLVFKEVE